MPSIFPFTAIVGQHRMRMALILNAINPKIGGVLIRGERGTAKSTAARAMAALLPEIKVFADSPFSDDPDDPDSWSDWVLERKAHIKDLPVVQRRIQFIDLPVSATEDRVVGTLDIETAIKKGERRFEPGVLAAANRGLLYVDEVNLLSDEVIDAILDASAQGHYIVRRGPVSAAFRSRFSLIGSMNPEEGRLRPQIMDRFGLRVIVRGLPEQAERLQAYQHVHAYQSNPRRMAAQFAAETAQAQQEIQVARDLLSQVVLPEEVAKLGLMLVERLQIDSLRAEITLFEAARAHTIADGRLEEAVDFAQGDQLVARLGTRPRHPPGMPYRWPEWSESCPGRDPQGFWPVASTIVIAPPCST